MEWKDDTRVFDKLIKDLTRLNYHSVDVGFFDDRYGPDNENMYVATVAMLQEEVGSSKIRYRPFFRTNFMDYAESLQQQKVFGKILENNLSGRMAPTKIYSQWGETLAVKLKDIIADGDKFAPNTAWWSGFKAKVTGGYQPPLNYTGKMRESVKFKVRRNGGDT